MRNLHDMSSKQALIIVFVFLLFNLSSQDHGIPERYASLPVDYPTNEVFDNFTRSQNELPDSAFFYFERLHQKIGIQLIHETNAHYRRTLRFILAFADYGAGVLAYRTGDSERANHLTTRALRQFLTLKDNEFIGLSLNSLGVMSSDKGLYKAAIRYYYASIRYKEKENDVSGVAHALNNIGVIFRDLGDQEEAKKYYKQSLKLYDSTGDSLGMAVCYNNLGAHFSKKDQLDSAFFFYEKALTIRIRLGDPGTRVSTLNNLSVVARKENKLELADSLLNEALILVERFPNRKGLAHLSLSIAELKLVKIKQNIGNRASHIKHAIDRAQLAYAIAHQLNNPDLKSRTSELLAELFALKGDWKQAYAMQNELWQLSKAQNSTELSREVIKETFRVEQQKSAEINRIKEENYRNSVVQRQRWSRLLTVVVSMALIAAIVVLVFIFIQLKRLKEKNLTIQRQNDERELLLKEIHHRVKNNFQIISSLLRLQAQSQERPEVQKAFDEAVHRIHALSLVHEIIYKQEDFTQIQTTPYFTRLFNQLEAMNLGEKVILKLNDQIGLISNELLFPMAIITNELVTNSFKYAFPSDGHMAPVIYLNLFVEKDSYYLEYSDNGIGYNQPEFSDSFGFELIETLTEQFNGTVVHVTSENGVKVIVSLTKEGKS